MGGAEIAPGDECFLWLTEDQGGAGLTASCEVISVAAQGRSRTVRLKVTQWVHSTLGSEGLRHYRNDSTTPPGLLARKLYRHAHNKVAAISEAEADWLRQRF